MDVDANNPTKYDSLTDGLMILRYLFNLSGATLVNSAIGPGATRNQAQIESYLGSILQ